MRTLKLAIPAGIVMTGFLLITTSANGTMQYMKKEGVKSCTVCHVKAPAKKGDDPNLNDTGKCYKANDHSLAKCNVTK
jgi:hypothetical protein